MYQLVQKVSSPLPKNCQNCKVTSQPRSIPNADCIQNADPAAETKWRPYLLWPIVQIQYITHVSSDSVMQDGPLDVPWYTSVASVWIFNNADELMPMQFGENNYRPRSREIMYLVASVRLRHSHVWTVWRKVFVCVCLIIRRMRIIALMLSIGS